MAKIKKQGFTLVELSIVLVIIGLLAGGVIFASGLIETSRNYKTVKRLEQYEIIVGQFYNKYGYWPGDMPANMAFAGSTESAINTGWPKGDGYVGANYWMTKEPIFAFPDLTASGMLPETYTYPDATMADPKVSSASWPGVLFPKLDRDGAIMLVSANYNSTVPMATNMGLKDCKLFLRIGSYHEASNDFADGVYYGGYLTATTAAELDTKFDDGRPGTGKIIFSTGIGSAANCVSDTTAGNIEWPDGGDFKLPKYNILTKGNNCTLYACIGQGALE